MSVLLSPKNSISLSLSVSIYLSIYLSIYQSIRLSVSISVYLSVSDILQLFYLSLKVVTVQFLKQTKKIFLETLKKTIENAI